jgi:hypothetical protein
MSRLICISFFVTVSYAFVAYDCFTSTTNYTTIGITTVEECNTQVFDDIVVKQAYIQVVQEKRWRFLHVMHCNVVVTKLINYCGMHSHISAVSGGYTNYVMDIRKDECKSLHTEGVLKIEGSTIRGIKPNTTQDVNLVLSGTLDMNGNCVGKEYVTPSGSYSNVVVQISAKIALKDYDTLFEIKTSKIMFNDGTACDIDKSECLHPFYGKSFWMTSENENCSPTSRDIIYEGESQISSNDGSLKYGSVITVNKDTSLFTLVIKSISHICHQRAYSTSHDRIYVIIREQYGFFFTRSPMINQNVDLTMYMNSKIAYTTMVTEKLIKNMYRDLKKQDCELERLTLINRLAIIRQHPQSFGHIKT